MRRLSLGCSIRFRLPLFISLLLAVVLGAFLWTVNRLLEQTLVRAGMARVQAAADQLGTVMAIGAGRRVAQVRQLAASDELREFLRTPNAARAAGARRLLAPLAVAGQPAVVVVRADGSRALEIAPEHGGAAPIVTATGFDANGLTEFHRSGDVIYYDVVAPVFERRSRVAPSPAADERLAVIVVRRTLTAAQVAATINRLVGSGATIGIGNRRGDLWSDFARLLPSPTMDPGRSGAAEYQRAGERHIGATSLVNGTPWTIWVDFPRETFLRPARTMLLQMLLLAAVFVVIGATSVAVMTMRITSPLHELTVASAAMVAGDLSRRVSVVRRDEIGRLGTAFNAMSDHIQRGYDELESRVADRTADLQIANQELEAFSYSVSHDLRAPLRHIAGFAALLERASVVGRDPQIGRYVSTIAGAATRMGLLIDDLLAFSRVGRTQLDRRPIDLDDLVREVQREVTPADRRIDWRIGDLPVVDGDRPLLKLALVNLVSNAVKYSSKREDPRIEIGVPKGTGDRDRIVFVSDNGVGFDNRNAHKLFGVFQRLHSSDEFEGTGIGLANVRRIIERHGGRVWAESGEGGGATFYFSLPVSDRP